MLKRSAIPVLILIGLVVLLAGLANCSGNDKPKDLEDLNGGDHEGRSVTPDVDWGLEDVESDDDGSSSPNGGSGGDPLTQEFTGTPDIQFELYVDAEPWDFDTPVEMYDGQSIHLWVHFIATGIELERATVRNNATISYPQFADLSGFEGDIYYQITFDIQHWGEGDIVVSAYNKAGGLFTRSLYIVEAPITEGDPEGPG